MRYQAKPELVNAWQVSDEKLPDWLETQQGFSLWYAPRSNGDPAYVILTQSGQQTARLGEWIIWGEICGIDSMPDATFKACFEPEPPVKEVGAVTT